MKILLSIITLLFNLLLNAQQPTFNWVNSTEGDASLIEDIDTDASGNLYVTGGYGGTVDFNPGAGVANMTSFDGTSFVAKYDPNGNYIWAVDFEYPTSGYDHSYGIAVTNNEEVYVVGFYDVTMDLDPGPGSDIVTAFNASNSDFFVVKLDVNGDYLWGHSFGGNSGDFAIEVATDDFGAVYIVGAVGDSCDFDPGPATDYHLLNPSYLEDEYILKLDLNGNFLWKHVQGNWSQDYFEDVVVDSDNNVYVAGHFTDTIDADPGPNVSMLYTPISNVKNVCVQKYSANGDLIWAGSMFSQDILAFLDMDIDNQNNIALTGDFSGLTDMDFSSGTFNINTSTITNPDAFTVKYDSSGTLQWVSTLSDSTNLPQRGQNVSIDSLGNVFSTGLFYGTVDFDPSLSISNLTSEATSSDHYIQKLNASGNFEWAGILEDKGGAASIEAIDIGANGKIYLTGGIVDTTDFDPNTGVQLLYPPPLLSWSFILCLNGTLPVGINNSNFDKLHQMRIYPNPINDYLRIKSDEKIQEIKLFNALGELVKMVNVENEFIIDLNTESLNNGIYILAITTKTKLYKHKIIKE